MTTCKKNGGNVLFIILIGIALFAALSFAVSKMNRGTANMSRENTVLAVNEIMSFTSALSDTVQTLLVGGVSISDLSFEDSAIPGYAHAPVVANGAKVFHASGGGMRYEAPKTAWLDDAQSAQTYYGDWYFPANVCVPAVGAGAGACEGDDADNEDIVVILPYVRAEICTLINKRLNVALCSGDACADADALWPADDAKHTGTFADDSAIASAGGEYTTKTEGCIEGAGTLAQPTGTYFYYKVLVAR